MGDIRGGGTAAKWSEELLERENKQNQNQMIPGPPPAWANLKKLDKGASEYVMVHWYSAVFVSVKSIVHSQLRT